MRDLDWSDVYADADRMFDEFLMDLVVNDQSDAELLRLRYHYGESARQGEPHGLAVIMTIDWLRSDQSDEPAWDDGSWEIEQYNRDLEAESLGRPLFPNEY